MNSNKELVLKGHECTSCNVNHNKDENTNKRELLKLGSAFILFLIPLIGSFSFKVELAIFLVAYIVSGGEVLLNALRNIARGKIFDENFLMSVATIGAFAIGEFPEGVAVMLFYNVGELLQEAAVNKSRKSIKALMDIRPDYANLKVGSYVEKVTPQEINAGDIIIIKPGERIPLDGIVVEGSSFVDTSPITGEPIPREVESGNEVLSGSINGNGVLDVRVSREYSKSTISRILELVENAGNRKAPTEHFITRFAKYYTPIVVFSSLGLAIIPPLIIPGAVFYDWIYRALIFLVISCPCALMVSIPLGFFGGIGGASRNGILVKGGNYLEALNNVDTVVFDKTGTLTKGEFKVTSIVPCNDISQHELLEYAAFAESYSVHPIGVSVLKAYGKEIDRNIVESYEEIPGFGIKANVDDNTILAGNARLMESNNIVFTEPKEMGTVVHIAVCGRYQGYLVISDEIKEDSAGALKELRGIGIRKLVMLTGDRKQNGEYVGRKLGMDEIYTSLLPHQKVDIIEALEEQKQSKGSVVFVGDGINDAPVLARADVGVAMGGLGSDAAIEASDVVLMTDEPSKLVSAIKIAKHTRRIVYQNIAFALGVKLVVLILGAGSIATMWEAVFADVGVAVLAVLNSMRAMKIK